MKPEEQDPYQRGGIVLLLGSMLFLILAFLRQGWSVAPLLILSAMGLFLTGLLVLTFSRAGTPDPVVASLLPVQHQINTATLLARAGSRDPAVFLPHPGIEGNVVQFHALPSAHGSPVGEAVPGNGGGIPGIHLPPSCLPLLRELEARFQLRIPEDPGKIPQLLQEVGEEALQVAVRVTVTMEPERVRVDLHRFAFYPGCRVIHATAPDTCVRNPCSLCSLLACLVVRGTGRECQIASVTLDDRTETVHLEFSLHPPVRRGHMATVPEDQVIPVPVVPPAAAISPTVLVPNQAGVAVPNEPAPVPAAGQASSFHGGSGIAVPVPPLTPIPRPVSQPAVTEREVTAWWIRHPGSRRLRYLGPDDLVSPYSARETDPAGLEVVPAFQHGAGAQVREEVPPSSLVPPAVLPVVAPPFPAVGVTPASEEGESPSMQELVARAMRDLESTKGAGPVTPVAGEPVPPSQEEPAAPPPADHELPSRGEPSPEGEARVPRVMGEGGAAVPEGRGITAARPPDTPAQEEPEGQAWWIRHPGSRRVRYLRTEEQEVPVKEPPEPVAGRSKAGPRTKKRAPGGSRRQPAGSRKK